MRVVCPYTAIHPLTEASLPAATERFYVGHAPIAYCSLLSELWAAGEAFMVVEHDVELAGQEAEALAACAEPWCTYGYVVGPPQAHNRVTASLGCARFSAALLGAEPDLMAEVATVSEGLAAGDWRRLDVTISSRLARRGYAPHVHGDVAHHHVYDGRCACGHDHDSEGAT